MKISNETKIGALTAVSITLLILGFNYLKGRNLIDTSKKVFAVFKQVDGLALSNPVMVNGLQIGTVYKMQEKNRTLDSIIITINLTKDVDIPNNSLASISKDLLGTATINIKLGNSTSFVKDGETLQTHNNAGLVDEFKSSLNPALNKVNGTLESLDSLLEIVGSYFDPNTKNNFHAIVGNLTASSASLQKMLNDQTGALAQSLNNVNSITGNFAKNNEKINQTVDNLERATSKLANVKIEETVQNLERATNSLNGLLTKVNSREGTLGLLLNDKSLYQNLNSTTYKINILLDDLRTHPKRYVNVSVFGKKDKSTPLTAPLSDDSTIINKGPFK